MLCKRPAFFEMTFNPRSDEEATEAITRLVDGTLSDAEQREVEAWASSTPELRRTVGLHRQVRHALATGGPPTPPRLVDAVGERIAASRGPAKARARRRSIGGAGTATGWGSVSRWRPAVGFGALSAVVAAIAVAVVLVTSGSGPSINAAARLAFKPATAPAPGVASARYLDVSYHGVTFPNYEPSMNAVATGKLSNAIGGRPALTVFYRLHGGERLSYTVFSGKPVGLPASARLTHFQGVPLRVYRTDGLSVVTLVRHGRTCVLAARASEKTILALAAQPVLDASAAAASVA